MAYVMVTGGVRSGKSAFAERWAGAERRVLYVATGEIWDGEMERRIQVHRDRRPAQWGLLEVRGELTAPIAKEGGWDCLLLDDMSSWVAQVLMNLPESEWRAEATRERVLNEAAELSEWLASRAEDAVVVTSETGLGGVALTPLGRAFQDLLGEVNQIMSARADEVYLIVSGRPLRLSGQ